jgi:hypothetical protein
VVVYLLRADKYHQPVWRLPQRQNRAACLTPRTWAIVPVHLGGRLADMDALMALAQQQHLVVIEDAAQAWGPWGEGQRGKDVKRGFETLKGVRQPSVTRTLPTRPRTTSWA